MMGMVLLGSLGNWSIGFSSSELGFLLSIWILLLLLLLAILLILLILLVLLVIGVAL